MKLYFSPGACSMAPHILLNEVGLPFQKIQVDLRTGKYEGGDYKQVNPKGGVPAMELDNGTVLTEGAVLLQYIADQKPESNVMPRQGSLERYQCMEWLNYIATELHKGFGPLWYPGTPEAYKDKTIEGLKKQFDFIAPRIKGQYLMGNTFAAPDAYMFTILGWANHHKIDMTPWPAITSYMARIAERPAVQKTLRDEGLTKSN